MSALCSADARFAIGMCGELTLTALFNCMLMIPIFHINRSDVFLAKPIDMDGFCDCE